MKTDEKLLDELDFNRIKEQISRYCSSEESTAALLSRRPFSRYDDALPYKKAGREWLDFITSAGAAPVQPWPQVEDLFDIPSVEGACLTREQLHALLLFSMSVEKIRDTTASASMELEIPFITETAASMPSLLQARNIILSVINPDGQIKDLPSIREIQDKISALNREIESLMKKYTMDPSLSSSLQSTVPAFKAGRELLAVKASKKGSIQGIVHEVSATGQTVYIEPENVVRANNALVALESELQAELLRIFREITSSLGMYCDDFKSCLTTMIFLDTTASAAKWAKEHNGIFCEYCDRSKEPPAIFCAKHPVLGKKAVGVDIPFMGGKNVMIITGPNTGGKTVTLKTTALFVLLNQAGFAVTAREGTRLPFFDSLYADIGDDQSIDESLSTFSSRMKKMAEMTDNATESSLVLLDELGSGTDPAEGSALAMACLDTLIQKGAFVLATTHHGVLKNYGWTNPSCINASVEFNADELKPTYRLIMGVPGESHAIRIAETAGLNIQIVEKARSYIVSEQADISALIKGLTQKHRELDDLLKEEAVKNAELQNKALRLFERETRIKERELELKEEEHRKTSEFLTQTRSSLENLVRTLREGEITREKTLGVKEFISTLEQDYKAQSQEIEELSENIEKEREEQQKEHETILANGMRLSKIRGESKGGSKKTKSRRSNKEAFRDAKVSELQTNAAAKIKKAPEAVKKTFFSEGDTVLAGKNRLEGKLVQKEKNGFWLVQLGSMRMRFEEKQLVLKDSPARPESGTSYVYEKASTTFTSDEHPVYELRLLGMRYEEAMNALQKQLDLCAIHNFRNFSVIHGKGTGALQQGVQDFLSNYPGVKSFSFASPEDGGFGKTYVELT